MDINELKVGTILKKDGKFIRLSEIDFYKISNNPKKIVKYRPVGCNDWIQKFNYIGGYYQLIGPYYINIINNKCKLYKENEVDKLLYEINDYNSISELYNALIKILRDGNYGEDKIKKLYFNFNID